MVFDAYVDHFNVKMTDQPHRIYDISELPYPKKTILAVLLKMLGSEKSDYFSNAIETGILHLENYREGVGKVPIDRLTPSILTSQVRQAETVKQLKSAATEIMNYYDKNKILIDRYKSLIDDETERMYLAIYAISGKDVSVVLKKYKDHNSN